MTSPWTRRQCLRRLAAFVAGSPLLGAQLVPRSQHDRVPSLDEMASVFEFEPVARAKMLRAAFDFLSLGVDGEFTLRRNRQAFDWVTLMPRAMADVRTLDLSTELFGQKLAHPILIDPTAGHQQFHPEGELDTHRGATAARAIMVVSSGSSYPIDKIAAAAEGPLWFQLYAMDTPEGTRERVEKALAAGCKAVCLTVDTQFFSHRERLLHDRHLSDGGPAQRAELARRRRAGAAAPPMPYGLRGQNPDLTWAMISTLRSYAKTPILLKGVMAAEDARLAVEQGADGIIVSNHGGRYLDYDASTLEALAECAEAVKGRVPVLMDGGVRRGADVLKALALGAKAVLVGRAPLWGLGAFGAAGVQRVLEILKNELALAMAHTGRTTLASIDRSLVRVDFP